MFRLFIIASLFLCVIGVEGQHWPKASPASQGMSLDSLLQLDKEISRGDYGYIDAMIILRHGKLVYEKKYKHDYAKIYADSIANKSALNPHHPDGQYNYYNPWWHPYYRGGELHSLQSVTKTITSIIIGVATTRGDFPDLSTPALKFFDSSKVKNIDDRKRRMTIRDLLTMTSGIDWNENVHYNDPRNDCTIMEASFDWVQYVIDKPMGQEPGKRFNYNSGATQLLAHIFKQATGKDIEQYAAQYLFAPLGIVNYFWKRTPVGVPDTEGGLYLTETDLAKIFYLFLRKGKWNGQQVVSADWVKSSVTPSTRVTPTTEYGYKWWLYGYGEGFTKNAWTGSGFGGQWPIIIEEFDIVAVFTGWNIISGRPALRVYPTIQRLVNAVTTK